MANMIKQYEIAIPDTIVKECHQYFDTSKVTDPGDTDNIVKRFIVLMENTNHEIRGVAISCIKQLLSYSQYTFAYELVLRLLKNLRALLSHEDLRTVNTACCCFSVIFRNLGPRVNIYFDDIDEADLIVPLIDIIQKETTDLLWWNTSEPDETMDYIRGAFDAMTAALQDDDVHIMECFITHQPNLIAVYLEFILRYNDYNNMEGYCKWLLENNEEKVQAVTNLVGYVTDDNNDVDCRALMIGNYKKKGH
eukprot:56646_1